MFILAGIGAFFAILFKVIFKAIGKLIIRGLLRGVFKLLIAVVTLRFLRRSPS